MRPATTRISLRIRPVWIKFSVFVSDKNFQIASLAIQNAQWRFSMQVRKLVWAFVRYKNPIDIPLGRCPKPKNTLLPDMAQVEINYVQESV